MRALSIVSYSEDQTEALAEKLAVYKEKMVQKVKEKNKNLKTKLS